MARSSTRPTPATARLTAAALYASLSPAERSVLAAALQTPSSRRLPTRSVPLNDAAATPVGPLLFDILDSERLERGRREFVGSTLWFRGLDGVTGPKGGVYAYGRAVVQRVDVLGPGVIERFRGTLKLASVKLARVRAGTPVDTWIRFDGDTTDTHLGRLANARPAPRSERKGRAS